MGERVRRIEPIAILRFVLIPKFCEMTGYSEKAVRAEIAGDRWRQGRHWVRAPDRHIMLDVNWCQEDPPRDVSDTPASKEIDARCGVYILRLAGAVVYVGRSTNMRARLSTHRKSGRPFDDFEVIPCEEATSVWLERELIRTLRPTQNLVRYTRHSKDMAWVIGGSP